jgi:glycosyltransferase involved in cell wall biosynthesis
MDSKAADEVRVQGHLISREPLIFWGASDIPYLAGPGSTLGPFIGDRRAWFLITPGWTREDQYLFEKDIEHFAELRALYPEHRHIMLCNTTAELENYRRANQPAIVANAGMFTDERRFVVSPPEPKRFDAIYNATFAPYKQHHLCTAIASLGLIYHRYSRLGDRVDYPDEVRAMLPEATYINELDGEFRHLAIDEITGWLARSHVGLCLSAVEGHMQACTEYLLCGLPVVSIPNKGARDLVLDPAYSIEAEPTPAAVAAAVQALKARQLDPHRIRAAAIAKLKPNRMRLLQLIAMIHREENVPFPDEADWVRIFRLGLWPYKTVAELLAEEAISETRRGDGAPAADARRA